MSLTKPKFNKLKKLISRLDIKFIFWTSILTVSITTLYFLYQFPQEKQRIINQLDSQGRSLTYAIVEASTGPILYDDIPALQTLAESMIMYDKSITVIRVWVEDTMTPLVVEEFGSDRSLDYRTYKRDIIVDETKLGRLEIGISTVQTDFLIEESLWAILSTALLMVLIKIATEYIVIERVVRKPLSILSKKAKKLGEGDLKSVICLPGTGELTLLAETLNNMRISLKESYDKISQQNVELKELDKLKDDFLANTSHEFKTPLNGILGLTTSILENFYGPVPDGIKTPINYISTSANRLFNLATQLLSFNPDKQTVELQEVYLCSHLNLWIDELRPTIAKKGLALEVNIEKSIKLLTDIKHLKIIFMNILDNAVKFTSTGYIFVNVRHLNLRIIAICVEDSGIGIDPLFINKIFDRFQQGFSSDSRGHEGSGLGLSIVQQSLHAISGEVRVQSKVSTGSTFTVLLSIDTKSDSQTLITYWESHLDYASIRRRLKNSKPVKCVKSPVETIKVRQDADKPMILVVDDDYINREVISSFLSKTFNTMEAVNGEECLTKIGQVSFEAILLDLMMPGMSGYDVLEKLIDDNDVPPILIVSAKDQTSDITKALELGAVDYITKPFKREELIARLKTHITLRRNSKQILEQKITERKLLEKSSIAEAASRAKSMFLSNMSHEIRTPMNAIIGLSDLALSRNMDDCIHGYLSKISNASKSLLRVLNDILDFSKIEAGKLEMENSKFLLRDVIEHVTDLFQPKTEESTICFIVNIAEELNMTFNGDSLRLEQILINILSNAFKFTNEGRITIDIDHRIDDEHPGKVVLRFAIADSGIGMSKDQSDSIFSPFEQAEDSTTRKYGGTGLGLTICKRLVSMMGGSIWVDSELGVGTTFYFDVALEVLDEDAMLILPDKLVGSLAIVVDDCRESAAALCNVLNMLGLIAHVKSSEELRTCLIDYEYVVAFVDIASIDTTFVKMMNDNSIKLILTTIFSGSAITGLNKYGIRHTIVKPINVIPLYNIIMEAFGYTSNETNYVESLDLNSIADKIRGSKILLVEDNKVNRQIVIELLNMVMVDVVQAVNGKEGVDKLEDDTYDAVLMDIQMPEMDGYTATSIIRSDTRFKDLPIIAMTAHVLQSDKEKSIYYGMSDHISKPIDKRNLYYTLIKWIPEKDNVGGRKIVLNQNVISVDELENALLGIDVRNALKRVNNNVMLFRSLLMEFHDEYSTVFELIEKYVNGKRQDDKKQAMFVVHAIKGVAGNIEAIDLFDCACQLETSLKSNNDSNTQQLLLDFNSVLSIILNSIEKIKEVGTEEAINVIVEPDHSIDINKELTYLLILLQKGDGNVQDIFDRLYVSIVSIVSMDVDDVALRELKSCIESFSYIDAIDSLRKVAHSLDINLDSN